MSFSSCSEYFPHPHRVLSQHTDRDFGVGADHLAERRAIDRDDPRILEDLGIGSPRQTLENRHLAEEVPFFEDVDRLALAGNRLADRNLSRLHDVHLVTFLTLAKYEVAFRETGKEFGKRTFFAGHARSIRCD